MLIFSVSFQKGTRWKEIKDEVSMHVAKDMLDIYPEDELFGSRYVLPSRKYFAKVAPPQLYSCITERRSQRAGGGADLHQHEQSSNRQSEPAEFCTQFCSVSVEMTNAAFE